MVDILNINVIFINKGIELSKLLDFQNLVMYNKADYLVKKPGRQFYIFLPHFNGVAYKILC